MVVGTVVVGATVVETTVVYDRVDVTLGSILTATFSVTIPSETFKMLPLIALIWKLVCEYCANKVAMISLTLTLIVPAADTVTVTFPA